jgi:hypothetical protein
MPQPFRRKPGQAVKVSPSVVGERPQFGIGMALIASHWSKVEESLGLAFTALLCGQEPGAFEAFHALFERNLRHTQFLAVAKQKKLPKELIDEAIKLQAEARKVAAARNAVVHGLWGLIADEPEKLYLCPPDASARRVDEFFTELHDRVDSLEDGRSREGWSFDMSVDDYTEYRFQDFQDIINRCIALDQKAFAHYQKVQTFSLAAERARRARRRRR